MTVKRRKIAIITGSRAEYGLLQWLMREIADDEALELAVLVTGMHLSSEFGLTYRAIEADGFRIDAKIEMLLASDDPVAITKSVGLGVIGFADALRATRPDIVVVLGDRFEILAAAQAAMLLRIPLAHIHGGELTEGALDESIRHAITKMAQLHFVAAAPYRRRVIQLGEDPSRVFAFGAPGLDAIARLQPLPDDELSARLGIPVDRPYFLVTYHPATLSDRPAEVAVRSLIEALDRFPDRNVVVTKSNADASGRAIGVELDRWGADQKGRVRVHTSLGQRVYLNAMRRAEAVVGNSSSGLIEAPAFRKPTVNIGERQRGRLRADSVIDCLENTEAIFDAVKRALSPEFTRTVAAMTPPFGGGDVSSRMKDVLKTVPLEGILVKRFQDLEYSEVDRDG